MVRRSAVVGFGTVLIAAGSAAPAQSPPTAPPQVLPPSILGKQPATAAPALTPAARQEATAPAARFQNLQTLPPETVQAYLGLRTGAEWLRRMNQANGRFLVGLNPAVNQIPDADSDLRQAFAALAVCQAARFTGDDRLAACGSQAILALLTQTRDDPADAGCKVPLNPSSASNRVGFAAVLTSAIYELPSADPKLTAEAEKLCGFLRKQCRPDGSIHYVDSPNETATTVDPTGVNTYPGLALHAVAASLRANPAPWKREALAKGVAYYRQWFRSKPSATLAGTVIPAAVDQYLLGRDGEAGAAALEMADWLCTSQYRQADVRQVSWVGGFRADPEPTFETAVAARGLAAAVTLTRQIPDGDRYRRYRAVLIESLGFVRGLQYTDDNTDHFAPKFRTHWLVGGVHLSPADGTVRIDATAQAVSAYLRFLESGAEQRN